MLKQNTENIYNPKSAPRQVSGQAKNWKTNYNKLSKIKQTIKSWVLN